MADMHAPDLPVDALLARLQPLLTGNGRVMIGYSGGLDSTVLLHWLAELPALRGRLQAVHVHHGLSSNADCWAEHCAAVCAHLNIPLCAEHVSVRNQGDGIEEAAREARYAAFCRHTQPGDWLLLGHHADDQTETVFMRLLRGAGLDGLAGMPAQRPLQPGVTLFRPLLTVSRAVLQQWAEARQLVWIEDESNADERYDRNWWRNVLLPQLWQRFPGRQVALQRSLQQLQQDQRVLQTLLQPLADDCIRPWPWPACAPLALDCSALQKHSNELQPYLVRSWLARLQVRAPSSAWWQQLQQVVHAADDAQPQLQTGAWQLRRHKGCLYLTSSEWLSQRFPQPQRISTDDVPLPIWAGTALVLRSAPNGLLPGEYRLMHAGACTHLSIRQSGRPSKRLNALLQEAGVPAPLRPYWPVLLQDDQLCAVAGIAVAEHRCLQNGPMLYWGQPLA